jgi:hypothetical protein
VKGTFEKIVQAVDARSPEMREAVDDAITDFVARMDKPKN